MNNPHDTLGLQDANTREQSNETRENLRSRIPAEWLEPACRFQENDYPCPRCGKQLPRYGEGVHICKQ